jgi:hypothetical protein
LDVTKVFGSIHKNRLKNTFYTFVKDLRFWEEIDKMFNAGHFLAVDYANINQSSLLFPFLFNIFMHDFDQFMENLNCEYFKTIMWFKNRNFCFLTAKKHSSGFIREDSSQTLNMFYALLEHNKKHFRIERNGVTNKGRPFEDA